MDKKSEAKPKKKGFFATLKESMTKTSQGCGPDCGCHVEEKNEEAKGNDETKKNDRKQRPLRDQRGGIFGEEPPTGQR